MLPILKIIWLESTSKNRPPRQPEPTEAMDDIEQVKSYVQAYKWGGPTSALQLHHLRELSQMIRPGDTVLDLACGPGPLLLELAPIFPQTKFIGADLSPTMLQYLQQEATARGLSNISILEGDIRTLPTLGQGEIDLVISTSALHHLPKEQDLRSVFNRIKTLLKPDGGYYLFDFALLKSSKTRKIFVDEVAKLAQPLTVRDYDLSLQAAFPLELVYEFAKDELPRPCIATASAFVDFFYLLQTPPRITCSNSVKEHIDTIWQNLSFAMKMEHLSLRWLKRKSIIK